MIFPKNQGGTEKKFQISKNNFIFVRRAPFGGGKGTGGGLFSNAPRNRLFLRKSDEKNFHNILTGGEFSYIIGIKSDEREEIG